MVTPSVTAPDS